MSALALVVSYSVSGFIRLSDSVSDSVSDRVSVSERSSVSVNDWSMVRW